MADFTNDLWSTYIAVLTILSIVGCALLLWMQSRARISIEEEGGKPGTTGHTWDEGLEELNHPMPRWWMWLFYITIVFGLVYLYLYPGLGSFAGSLGWKSTDAYQAELKKADIEYGPLFDKYLKQDIKTVAADKQAQVIGERLFLTYCAQCHGSDARGSKGYPNLTDDDWLHGGAPEVIKTTILQGRVGQMPPMGQVLGSDQDVVDVAHYALSLSSKTADPIRAAFGKDKYNVCMGCHGANGQGNQALGAPNLSDKVWLYGGSKEAIMETISKGRKNTMPDFKDFLGEAKVHVLSAYVWGLSNEKAIAAGK